MVTKICVRNYVGDFYHHAKFYPNRFRGFDGQIGVGDSKYVIVFDPLFTGHVIRRMRGGRVRIFNANQWETL